MQIELTICQQKKREMNVLNTYITIPQCKVLKE